MYERKGPATDHVHDGMEEDRDRANLERLGKKPVLKRNFGTLSILGLSCTILGTWESLLSTFINPLENGGPGGTVYAIIFSWIGTGSTFVILAELASMAPTSGGQYHWCAMLAPQSAMKFLSYITGWLTIVGWQTAFASAAYLAGTQIQGVAILAHSTYNALPYQGTLICWAALLVTMFVNVAGGKLLPRAEIVLLGIHVLGFVGILIALTVTADHTNTHEVFTEFVNTGGFPTQGLSWFVGMTSAAFAFAGGDGAVHMAEECANASVAIPRAIVLSVLINGSMGFGMVIAMLFCMGNVTEAMNSPTGYPYMEIFYQATGSMPGTLAMLGVLMVNSVCCMFGLLASTSRQFWSFSRDRGVPGWRVWSRVSTGQALPIYSIVFTITVSWLLAIINIGSSVALNDILSMAVSGLYLSYLTVGSLLLYRRVRGQISRFNDSETVVNVPGAKLVWGPFHVPGIWGVLVNTYALIYMLIVIFFSFWPPEMSPKVTTMNYSVVGTGGAVIIAVVYYIIRARHVYKGPVMEVTI